METKANIGNVYVVKGMAPNNKTYLARKTGQDTFLNERVFMLLQFFLGKDTTGHTLWYAPMCGGASIITRDDVDWETSGIPNIKGDWHRDGEVLKCMKCGRQCFVDEGMTMDYGMRCRCDGH